MGVGLHYHGHSVDIIALMATILLFMKDLNIQYITVCLKSLTTARTTESNLLQHNEPENKQNTLLSRFSSNHTLKDKYFH